jgi:hypothetical protein
MNSSLSRGKILTLILMPMIGATAYFVWKSRFGGSEILRSRPVLKKDLALLVKGDAPVNEAVMALHRLNSYRVAEGLEEALKREKDPRPEIRSAVAVSLAMHPMQGRVLEAESRLLQDPEETVRIAALSALTRVSDPGQRMALQRAMENPKKSVREEFLIHAGLYGATQNAERKTHLDAIHSLLDQHKKDHAITSHGLAVLARLSSEDQKSRDLIQNAFVDPATRSDVLPLLYRSLLRSRPEVLVNRFSRDAESRIPGLRLIALNSVLELCPPDRWTVMVKVMKDPATDSQTKAVVKRIATYLGGKTDAEGMIHRIPESQDRCGISKRSAPGAASSGKGERSLR